VLWEREISEEEEGYIGSAPSSSMLWAGLDSCCSLLCRENVKLLLTLVALPQQHLECLWAVSVSDVINFLLEIVIIRSIWLQFDTSASFIRNFR